MEVARSQVFQRSPGLARDGTARPPWSDVLAITELGRAVLCGKVDFQSLNPRARWVGGVQISAETPDWRWDEAKRIAVLREG
jgi:hypothetical protein